MPRACVIVLDAVGAGELPDAASYGDEGSNTLGNVARAVGGLDLPSLEALGLGNVMPLEGCPPQPGAPAVAGRLLERSKGKDTTTGHWELMGVVTPTADAHLSARLPARRGRPLHAQDRPRRPRQQAGLGDRDHPGARRGAPADGEVDRLHLGGLRLPDRRARGDHPAGGALRGLSSRLARSSPASMLSVASSPGRSTAIRAATSERRTGTITRSSRAVRTTCHSSATAGRRFTRWARSATSLPAATSMSPFRPSPTSTGSTRRWSCCTSSTTDSYS